MPMMIWRPKTFPITTTEHPTKSSTSTHCQEVQNAEERYDFLTLERMSAPALTADAHGSHCSMTHSSCTASSSHTFKHSAVVRVNPDLAQALVFPPKHAMRDSTSNCCPEDTKQEGGSNWWLTMRKTIRNTSLQVFVKE